jgi:hypothetical protein
MNSTIREIINEFVPLVVKQLPVTIVVGAGAMVTMCETNNIVQNYSTAAADSVITRIERVGGQVLSGSQVDDRGATFTILPTVYIPYREGAPDAPVIPDTIKATGTTVRIPLGIGTLEVFEPDSL